MDFAPQPSRQTNKTKAHQIFPNFRMSGKSTFGSQELSQRTSAPSYGFGSSTRTHASKVFQGAEHVKTYNYGVASPGPCYNPRSAMGKQPEGGNATMPQWQFGTERRFSQRRAGTSPGMCIA
eukprot:6199440-Pleurochrysis_carterae.AAC.2